MDILNIVMQLFGVHVSFSSLVQPFEQKVCFIWIACQKLFHMFKRSLNTEVNISIASNVHNLFQIFIISGATKRVVKPVENDKFYIF